LSKYHGIPLIFHVHGDQTFGKIEQNYPIKKLYRLFISKIVITIQSFTLHRAINLCFVSRLAMNEFLFKYDLLSLRKKSIIIPNGVDLSIFSITSKKQKILLKKKLEIPYQHIVTYVGRIDRKKGVDLLIRSIRLLNIRSLCCLIITPKPDDEFALAYNKDLQNLSTSLKITCIFIQNPKNISEYYSISDCVVLPSEQEMAPMVVLEALASGVPIITSNVGGTKEFMDYSLKTLLLKSRKPKNIAKLLLTVLRLPNKLKQQMKNDSQRIIRRYSWPISVKLLHKLFTEFN
jgi:glycosyltransferase involved in cell wall biosynthesis